MNSELPSGWRRRKIKEIANVVGGSTPDTRDPSNYGGSIPWITVKDLSQHKKRYIFRGGRNITRKGLAAIGNRLIPKGSLLISTRAPIGYLAIAGTELTTNQGIRSLVFKPNCECIPEFVYYLIKHNTKVLKRFASGSTFREI
ncbi:MAG: restriction endonuclease subunit S, partial [Thermoproteota archaeon]